MREGGNWRLGAKKNRERKSSENRIWTQHEFMKEQVHDHKRPFSFLTQLRGGGQMVIGNYTPFVLGECVFEVVSWCTNWTKQPKGGDWLSLTPSTHTKSASARCRAESQDGRARLPRWRPSRLARHGRISNAAHLEKSNSTKLKKKMKEKTSTFCR